MGYYSFESARTRSLRYLSFHWRFLITIPSGNQIPFKHSVSRQGFRCIHNEFSPILALMGLESPLNDIGALIDGLLGRLGPF